MNRSIMMRKYGLDENQAYVEQSTLLEPNNFIPSWVRITKHTLYLNLLMYVIGSGRWREEGSIECIEEAQT